MSLKKITSLTMLLAMVIMTYSGIMLFIAPPGRIANWSDWQLFGLSKDQYANLHSSFMLLFVVATILHIYYNWKPITSYMKNQAKQMVVLTRDMMAAILFTVIFLIGSLTFTPPFSTFLNFGQDIKNSWEKSYGSAPYSHAELSSLEDFSKKIGLALEKSAEILSSHNMKYELSQSLSQIADTNGVSPQYLFNLLKKDIEKGGKKLVTLTGMGKKAVKDVAMSLGLSTQEFLEKLKALGIEANENDRFKELAERYDMSPMDIMHKLGYKKPE